MSKVHALRLNNNGPRRVRFNKTVDKTAISYGRLVFISEEALADINTNDAKFFDGLKRRNQVTLLSGDSEADLKREHARMLADELANPGNAAQAWKGIERDKDTGIPTVSVGSFDSESAEARGDGDGVAEANAKASRKAAAFSRNERSKKGAAQSAA